MSIVVTIIKKALVIQSRLIYQELSEIMTGKGIKEQTLSILLTTFILQILGMKFY
jgi:Trk-type K+ transport system membrane component